MIRDDDPFDDRTSDLVDEHGLPRPGEGEETSERPRRRRWPLSPGELVSDQPHDDEDRAAARWVYLEAVKKYAPERYEAARQVMQAGIPPIGPLPLDDDEEPPRFDPAEERAAAYLRRVRAYMERQTNRRKQQGFTSARGRLSWNPQAFEALVLYEIKRMSETEIVATLGLPGLNGKQHVSQMIRKAAAVLGIRPRKGLPGIKKSHKSRPR